MSALLASQGATTRAIMPLGFVLGINPWYLIAMFPPLTACLFFQLPAQHWLQLVWTVPVLPILANTSLTTPSSYPAF